MDTGVLEKRFEEIYGTKVEHLYFAPGRVNLIGEHIDYNGGRVFPCALSFGTYLAVARREDRKIAFASMNQTFQVECDQSIFENKPSEWVKYPLGVVKEFSDRGLDPWGFNILYFGDIPNGAGLSSSASIEVVTAFMLNDQLNAGLDVVELVKMSQRAENVFVGMNCGIMDQFAVGMGKKGHAIALDCGTLDYDLIPLNLNGYKLVITNSNKNHDLVTSEYNVRRSQCEQALADINQGLNLKHLCDLSEEELEWVRHLISDETVYRRARQKVGGLSFRHIGSRRVRYDGDSEICIQLGRQDDRRLGGYQSISAGEISRSEPEYQSDDQWDRYWKVLTGYIR